MGLPQGLTLLLGLLTGLALGALGSGGSSLALPAFVYAAGVPVKSAVATSLAVVGTTSLIGAIIARRRCATVGCPGQEVDTKVAVLFVVGGLAGAFTGARLAHLLPDGIQMLIFSVAVLGTATAMLRRKGCADDGQAVATARLRAAWLVPALGLGVGMLTGVIGVGGGFLIVPALTLVAHVPIKRAVATSLWIIAANSAMGVLGYVGHVPFAWNVAGIFLAASLIGMLMGQRVARSASSRRLQGAFAVFLIAVGLFTVVRTVGSPSTARAPGKPEHTTSR